MKQLSNLLYNLFHYNLSFMKKRMVGLQRHEGKSMYFTLKGSKKIDNSLLFVKAITQKSKFMHSEFIEAVVLLIFYVTYLIVSHK